MTIAGSSCGVMPIAIASENSSASISGRCSATLITKIDAGQHAGDPHEQLREVAEPGLERRLGLALAEPGGDLAERRAVPVATTTPRPAPWCTTVPMNAHDGRSPARRRPPRPARSTSPPAATRR